MLIGAHAVVYSKDPDADRAFLRDVLELPSVDAGHGWLIFALPPSEVAVHPSDANDEHELYLLCDDVQEFVRSLEQKRIACSPVHEEQWGSLTQVTLPGGGMLGVYEPKHPRPSAAAARRPTRKKAPAATARAKAAMGMARGKRKRR